MPQDLVVLVGTYNPRSMTVRALHAVLEGAGIPVRSIIFKRILHTWICDPPSERDIHALVGLIKELDPMLVGMSVVTACSGHAAEITGRLRRETNAFILWGGIHPTLCPEDCLAHADAVCRGEGEAPLVELATALRTGQPYRHIRNLWFREGGRIIRNEMRPLIADLDEIPFPSLANEAVHLVDGGRVLPPPSASDPLSYDIMTSRGCPYRCGFCFGEPVRRMTDGLGPDVRRHSVRFVIEELRRARNAYPNMWHVQFWDDIFTLDKKWLQEFAGAYRAEIGLPFFCYGHPLTTTPSAVALLKEAGVDEVALGIQSGSPRVRKEQYQRPETNEEILELASMLRQFEIKCIVDLIADNPLETTEDNQTTLELLLSLPRPFALVSNGLVNIPGTTLTRMLLDRGAIRREDVEDVKTRSLRKRSYMLDLDRDREFIFWECLFHMASRRSYPARLIRWLSRGSFARRHARGFARLLRLTTESELSIDRRSRLSLLRIRVAGWLLKIYRGIHGLMRRVANGIAIARSPRP